MEKKIVKESVYYKIIWSKPQLYDRHMVMGIPSTPGIVSIFREKGGVTEYLLFYACWKSGVRNGARNLLDPNFSQFPELIKLSEKKDLLFKYNVVDTSPEDMQDILYWLITEYLPQLNNANDFSDSGRYREIFMKELFDSDEIKK